MGKWLWFIVPGAAIVGLVVWRIVVTKANSAQLSAALGANRKSGASVQVATAGPGKIVTTIVAPASLESPYQVKVAPQITGVITELNLREGDSVTQGQVLAKLDPSSVEAAVIQAQANVAQAEENLAHQQLGTNPAVATVTSGIEQQNAAVATADANLNQVEKNYAAQVQNARSAVTDNQAKVSAAQSAVTNARASLNEQHATLNDAEAKLNRSQELFDKGFIAAQDLDDAKAAAAVAQGAVGVGEAMLASAQQGVNSANAQLVEAEQELSIVIKQNQANIDVAKAAVKQAQAALKLALANKFNVPAYTASINALKDALSAAQAGLQQAIAERAFTVMRSPITGTVTARTADPGSVAAPGTPVLTIEYLDTLYVQADFPVENSGQIAFGQTGSLTLDSMPGRALSAVVSNVNKAADPTSRRFEVLAKLQNPGHVFRPGMYGTLTFTTQDVTADVLVPIEAVRKAKGQNVVYLAGSDHLAHLTPVTLGATDGASYQILSGVKAGDQVITVSYATLKDGMRVTVPTQGAPAGLGSKKRNRSGGSGTAPSGASSGN